MGFGHAGIADEQDVDVASEAGAVGQHFLQAAEEHAEQGALDVLVAVDGGRQGFGQQLEHVLRLHARELLALADVFARDED